MWGGNCLNIETRNVSVSHPFTQNLFATHFAVVSPSPIKIINFSSSLTVKKRTPQQYFLNFDLACFLQAASAFLSLLRLVSHWPLTDLLRSHGTIRLCCRLCDTAQTIHNFYLVKTAVRFTFVVLVFKVTLWAWVWLWPGAIWPC